MRIQTMKRALIVAGSLAAATLFLLWWFSAEQVLKRRIESMLSTAEVPPGMSDAGRKARGGHLAGYLAKQVHFTPPESFDLPVSSPVERDTAAALYSGAATYAKEITFTDIQVEKVAVEDGEATVNFSADTIVDLRTRRPVDGILHVYTFWKKSEEGWLLESFSWTESSR